MIEINLLPEALRKAEPAKLLFSGLPIRKALLIFLGAAVLGQLFLSAFAGFRIVELSWVKKSVESLAEKNSQTALQKSQTELLKEQMERLGTLTQRKFFWSALLEALSHSVTKGVWLRTLSVVSTQASEKTPKKKSEIPLEEFSAPKKKAARPAAKEAKAAVEGSQTAWALRIEGSAMSQGQETAAVARFIKELKGNATWQRLFAQVELAQIQQRRIKDLDVYDFVIVCPFQKERMDS